METYHPEVHPDQVNNEEKKSGFWRFFVDVLETLILSVILFMAINAVSARIRVDGSSMETTLHSGEFVIVNKISYKLPSPTRGDIVVFHFPRDPEQEYIKRVIGLPGDEVSIAEGNVFVNGQQLNEPYIASKPSYPGKWTVPDEHLFVLGDNRNNSSDSHSWGYLPEENLLGKAMFVYWPPSDWGQVTHAQAAN